MITSDTCPKYDPIQRALDLHVEGKFPGISTFFNIACEAAYSSPHCQGGYNPHVHTLNYLTKFIVKSQKPWASFVLLHNIEDTGQTHQYADKDLAVILCSTLLIHLDVTIQHYSNE